MLVVTNVTNLRSTFVVAKIKAIEEVKTFIHVAFMEEDADHPGHYDIMDKFGNLFTVEPEKC